MQAVVLAGGLATRMRPRTLTVPKAMLEVAGRPFVDWQLEKLRDCGFDDVVLCVAFLAEQIRDHVGDGGRYGVKVRYSDEGATLLGTAGAIRKGLDLLAPTFLVTYGDSYLPFDYASPLRVLDAHADCAGVMSIFENRGAWDMSNVEADAAGEWIVRYEKGRARSAAAVHRLRRYRAAARDHRRAPPGSPSRARRHPDRARRGRSACEPWWLVTGSSKLARPKGSPRSISSSPRSKTLAMIVSRAPVRFSLGGGGTDLPSYSKTHGGFLVAAAIDKHVYVGGEPALLRQHPPRVLADRDGRLGGPDRAPHLPRGAPADGRDQGDRARLASPTCRRTRGSGRRARSRWRS